MPSEKISRSIVMAEAEPRMHTALSHAAVSHGGEAGNRTEQNPTDQAGSRAAQTAFMQAESNRLGERERDCLESRQSLVNIFLAAWAIISAGFAAVVEMWGSDPSLWSLATALLICAGVVVNVVTYVRLQVNVCSLLHVRVRQALALRHLQNDAVAPQSYPLWPLDGELKNQDGEWCNTYTPRTNMAFKLLAIITAILVWAATGLSGFGVLRLLYGAESVISGMMWGFVVVAGVSTGGSTYLALSQYYAGAMVAGDKIIRRWLR